MTTPEPRRTPHAPALVMLPGLGESAPIRHDLEESTRTTLEARRNAGYLDQLDEGLAALALSNARKLDASVGIGRPSGRAKLLQGMSDVLDKLREPESTPASLLTHYRAALTGAGLNEDAAASPFYAPNPPIEPREDAGPTERGIRDALRARQDAGLSTAGYAAHETLALMAAADLDLALNVGAPSGYAAVSAALASILERLPRPSGAATSDVLDALLAAIPDEPSPFHALPEAAYHPERDPNYLTEGAEIAAVNRALGRHFQPWQRKAIDVATEYTLDDQGRRCYRYQTILVVVPRQSGKTDLTAPVQIHRALTRETPAACWYTAQTGQDARKRMLEVLERVEPSPLAALLSPTRSNGAEGLRVQDMPGAHITRFSPTHSALHGEHPHLVTMDEIWHFPRELGDALLGAVEPAQITLGNRAQLWLVSTMGTHASEWMNDLVARGRAGTDPSICYIEYSLADGLDPLDPASWATFHPALGNTIALEDLQQRAHAAADDPARLATFLRAYCNRLIASDGALIDLAQWDDLALPVKPPARDTLTISYEVAPGGALASVVAAWTDADTGRPCIRIVRQALGTAWLAPYLIRLHEEWHAALIADGAGPAGRFTQQLLDLAIPVRRLRLPEFGQATEGLLSAIVDGDLIHDGSDELREQIAAVEVRTTNGVRRWHRDSPRPVPGIIAASVALYGHQHPEIDTTAPTIVL